MLVKKTIAALIFCALFIVSATTVAAPEFHAQTVSTGKETAETGRTADWAQENEAGDSGSEQAESPLAIDPLAEQEPAAEPEREAAADIRLRTDHESGSSDADYDAAGEAVSSEKALRESESKATPEREAAQGSERIPATEDSTGAGAGAEAEERGEVEPEEWPELAPPIAVDEWGNILTVEDGVEEIIALGPFSELVLHELGELRSDYLPHIENVLFRNGEHDAISGITLQFGATGLRYTIVVPETAQLVGEGEPVVFETGGDDPISVELRILDSTRAESGEGSVSMVANSFFIVF